MATKSSVLPGESHIDRGVHGVAKELDTTEATLHAHRQPAQRPSPGSLAIRINIDRGESNEREGSCPTPVPTG